MGLRLTGLWCHANFRRFWAGRTISIFGSAVTEFALPLTAVIILEATPAQMGFLRAVEFAPFLLISLFAGVWVDRLPRRTILIGADLGRALLLGSIPTAAALGVLRIEYLYLTAFCVGIFKVFFDVSYQAFLPSLVKREQLVEGNSKLQVSQSVAQIAGPGLAGGLVELFTAPLAIALDSFSFILSALFLSQIRTSTSIQTRFNQRGKVWSEIGEGLQIVLKNPLLRSIAGCTSTTNLFNQIIMSMYVLYVTRLLGIKSSVFGIILAIGAGGVLVGALLAGRAVRWFGLGRAIMGASMLRGLGALLIPFTSDSLMVTILFLAVASFLTGLSKTIYDINQVSLRQAIVPNRWQGRMNASMRFIVWGTIPIGALIGGFLGETIGVRLTLWVGAVGLLLAFLWVLISPVYALQTQPEPVEET